MALSEEQLERIEAFCESSRGGVEVTAFRQTFPGVVILRCDASDVGDATPVRSWDAYDLHLVDAHGHCVTLTSDPQAANGVLLAKHAGAKS